MFKKRALAFLTGGLFLILLFIRLVHLSADPPYNLSTSGAPWGDPGGYSFNARNKILFDRWEIDNYNMMYASYPPHLVTYLVFKLLGIGFAQMNLEPVFFSWLALIFFFFVLREKAGQGFAFLGTGLLGLNYLFLMFSRIANRIMPSLFFLVLGIYFLFKNRKKGVWLLAAGASFALCLLSKSVMFYALGGVIAGYLGYSFFSSRLREISRNLVFLVLGFLVPSLPWFFFLYLPHRDFIQSFSRLNVQYLIPPKNPSLILKYFWTRPAILLEEMPVISVCAALFSLLLLFRIVHWPKTVQMIDWIFLGWFLFGYLYYAVIQQRVTRHYIPHILPLVYMAVSLARHFLTHQKLEKPKKTRLLFALFVFFWMIFPASQLLIGASKKLPRDFFTPVSLILTLLLLSFVYTAFVLFLLSIHIKREKEVLPRLWKKGLVFFLLLGCLTLQGSKYLTWALSPPFQLKEASQDFGKAFQKAAIAGLWAPVVCLENKHRAHEYFPGFINDDKDFFEKFGITHVFTTTAFGEDKTFERNFPQVMSQARLLARYHIWIVEALLYDVHPEEKEADPGLFEAEVYTQKGSTPRFDIQASQNFAVLCRSKKPGFVVFIPGQEKYGKGKYEVTFGIKKHKPPQNPLKRIARLDVVSEDAHQLLAYQDIHPKDLGGSDYQTFHLPLNLKRPRTLTFRVFGQGNGQFWVDWVRIQRIE